MPSQQNRQGFQPIRQWPSGTNNAMVMVNLKPIAGKERMMLTKEAFLRSKPDPDYVYDVLVAGSGPAGIGAALAAAMSGAKVLLLEGRNQLGGTMTAAMWMNYNFIYKDNDETDRGGVNRLLAERVDALGPVATTAANRPADKPGTGGNIVVHPEYMKQLLFDLLEEHGVYYQLYSPVFDVEKKDDTITGIVVLAKQGPVTYRGRSIVDATGDGDVAYHAGCAMEEGFPAEGTRAPITLAFALCNVDTDELYAWLDNEDLELDRSQYHHFNEILNEARRNGYMLPNWVGFDKTNVPGVVSFNNGTSGELLLDGTQSYDLTIVEKLGVGVAIDFVRFVKDYRIPGMQNASLIRTGGFAAVRETRRLIGEYVFTDKDVMEGTDFADAIASKYGGRDPVAGKKHPYTGIKQGALYPYRSLLPKEVDGLLVAGRCGSADYLGHYGGKSIGNMMAIGQAAGVAGALCARTETRPRALDYRLVQDGLKNLGVVL